MREICKSCKMESTVGFSVPDDVWCDAVPQRLANQVLCIACFTWFADNRLIQWDTNINFFPVSLSTLNQAGENIQ